MPVDYNFIEALSIGMPPISGWGMRIERFFLLLTDSKNIRDVVLFPLLREEQDLLKRLRIICQSLFRKSI